MKVIKFGGAAIGSASKVRDVVRLVDNEENKIVVFSAFEGTTNTLIEISDYLYKKNTDGANEVINRLEQYYFDFIVHLYSSEAFHVRAKEFVKSCFDLIRSYTKDLFTLFEEKIILAQGELMSSELIALYMEELGRNPVLICALDFMRTDKNGDPDFLFIKENLTKLLAEYPAARTYITQGYISRNAYGEIDNLERKGSDYSASLIGAAIEADEIRLWTAGSGMYSNDPEIVAGASLIKNLQFDEAAELAYFGSKVLHPTCILPAKLNNIPVRLLDLDRPEDSGTLISNQKEKGKIKAVAAKDGITAIKVKSGRMLLAYGFLRKVFEIFEGYQTSIDMVTTSEVGVSLTIDNLRHLQEITDDLKKYGTVSVDEKMTIICVVGDLDWENTGFQAKIMNALKDIPIRMISYGGSNHNVSFLIKAEDKKKAMQFLNDHLFSEN
jgi:aspartate kinase